MGPRTRALLGGAVAATVMACDRGGAGGTNETPRVDKSDDPEKAAPPKGHWSDKGLGSTLKFDGAKESVEVSAKGERGKIGLYVKLDGFPKGTKAKLGEASITVDNIERLVQAWLPFELGGVSISDARDSDKKTDLGATLVIEWPTTMPLEIEIPPQKIWGAIGRALAAIDKSPVKFEGEPADDGKVDTLLALRMGSSAIREVFGTGEKLQDVDLLATEANNETKRTKKCTGYEKGDIELTMVDTVVAVYDRRTGKLVQEKTFSGKDTCPTMAYVSKDGAGKSYADPKLIDAWLRSLVK